MSSDLGNKKVMAENIKHYMAINNVNSAEMCKILAVSPSTFSYWINAKYYPRIDKIEQMANYFHISKADLVEKRKDPATSGGGLEEKIDLSQLSEDQKISIQELQKLNPHFQALARGLIESLLSSQQAGDNK